MKYKVVAGNKPMKMLRIKVGTSLKNERKKAGLSKYGLAKKDSGISSTQIAAAESGKRAYTIDTLNAYLLGLNLELGEFVAKKDAIKSN